MMTNNRKGQKGTALVEAALTLTLYAMLVFSIFDFGYVMFMHQMVTYRVAAAARYGALNPADSTGMRNFVMYNQASGSGPGLFGITSSNVSATRQDSGTIEDRVVVTVTSFHYPMIWPGMRGNARPISVSLPVEAD